MLKCIVLKKKQAFSQYLNEKACLNFTLPG